MIYICLCVTLLYLAFLLEPNGIRVERTREYAFPPVTVKAQPRDSNFNPVLSDSDDAEEPYALRHLLQLNQFSEEPAKEAAAPAEEANAAAAAPAEEAKPEEPAKEIAAASLPTLIPNIRSALYGRLDEGQRLASRDVHFRRLRKRVQLEQERDAAAAEDELWKKCMEDMQASWRRDDERRRRERNARKTHVPSVRRRLP